MSANRLLTPDDVQAFLQRAGIPGVLLRLGVPTPTVETAAQAVDCQPEQIIKSILFLVDGQPVLAITCGQATIERRAIAGLYGVGRKRVKLASPEEVEAVAGYAVGAMPPFGHRERLPTLIDPRVLEQSEVYGGGGAENALLRLRPEDLVRVTQAQVIDLLARQPEAER